MDYIPFQTPGDACMYALRQGYELHRRRDLDTLVIVGIQAIPPDDGGPWFILDRVGTHYQWRPL